MTGLTDWLRGVDGRRIRPRPGSQPLAEHLALMRHDGRPTCDNPEHTDLLRLYGQAKLQTQALQAELDRLRDKNRLLVATLTHRTERRVVDLPGSEAA